MIMIFFPVELCAWKTKAKIHFARKTNFEQLSYFVCEKLRNAKIFLLLEMKSFTLKKVGMNVCRS